MRKKVLITVVAVIAVVLIASSMVVLLTNNGLSGTAKVLTRQSSVAFGNLNNETFQRCAVDAEGNLYVLGTTDAQEENITNGYDTMFNGEADLIVIEYSPDLSTIIAATYLGGSEWDQPWEIKIGPNGDVYILGFTRSLDFPTIEGAFDRINEEDDTFVAQLSPDLTKLRHSTFLGYCGAFDMAFDEEGNVLVCGDTRDPEFPTTAGAYDRTFEGEDDAFIAKLSADLSTLLACTLFGGPSYDSAHALALDNAGHVYIAGETFLSYEGYNLTHAPTTPGAYSDHASGTSEGYVAEFSSDLSTLMASTMLGGSDYDNPLAVLVRADGSILIGGSTHSTDFPLTGDAMSSSHRFPIDAFICEMSPDLRQLNYSTFLGLGVSYITTMLEGRDGKIYLSSQASHLTSTMPTTEDAFDTTWGGFNCDGFVTVLSGDLKKISYASYLGGNGDEECTVDLGPDGSIYVVGFTRSTDFPTIEDSSRTQDNGYWDQSDGFVIRFQYV